MRLVLLYLSLVGVPIAGILGILHVGERLTPPIAVGGAWIVEVEAPATGVPACNTALWQAQEPILTISQSGPHLQLTLSHEDRITFLGEIREGRVTAEAEVTRAAANIPEDRASAHLEAWVDHQAQPMRLRGVLTMIQCAARTDMPFVAVRQLGGGQ
jgi:hypothetical protein